MLYFALPNFYEHKTVNLVLYAVIKQHPQWLKAPVSLYSFTGCFPYSSWNGTGNSNLGIGAFYKDFIAMQEQSVLPDRLNCSNVLLEDYDIHDVMNQTILNIFNNGSTVLEVASIPFMEQLQAQYPEFRYVFSKNADLITAFTPDLLNAIAETNNFLYIGIPDKYNHDFDFLKALKHKTKFELTVNPRCPHTCKDYDSCWLLEQKQQLDYSNNQHIFNCRKSNAQLTNAKQILTIEDLQKTYLPLGFNHFTFAPQYCMGNDQILGFYIQYFFKPEFQQECSAAAAQLIQTDFGGQL